MRRIVLVLALTALLVAWALASSALAQGVQGCAGLQAADDAQDPQLLPPRAVGPAPPPEGAATNPSQGEEHSAVEERGVAHHCMIK